MEQESQLINEPQHSSINGSSSIPWKGRLKFSNIVHGNFQTSFNFFSCRWWISVSENSADEESKVLSVITLGVRMAQKTLKTHDNNSGV